MVGKSIKDTILVQACSHMYNECLNASLAFGNNIQWFSVKVNGKFKLANSMVCTKCISVYLLYIFGPNQLCWMTARLILTY